MYDGRAPSRNCTPDARPDASVPTGARTWPGYHAGWPAAAEVWLAARRRPPLTSAPAARSVLYICSVWPAPTASAAGVRSMQLIETLADRGARVTVASPARLGEVGAHSASAQS